MTAHATPRSAYTVRIHDVIDFHCRCNVLLDGTTVRYPTEFVVRGTLTSRTSMLVIERAAQASTRDEAIAVVRARVEIMGAQLLSPTATLVAGTLNTAEFAQVDAALAAGDTPEAFVARILAARVAQERAA